MLLYVQLRMPCYGVSPVRGSEENAAKSKHPENRRSAALGCQDFKSEKYSKTEGTGVGGQGAAHYILIEPGDADDAVCLKRASSQNFRMKNKATSAYYSRVFNCRC